jgi:anti-sigma regulatory factor (Ser/Thr protein kinase)
MTTVSTTLPRSPGSISDARRLVHAQTTMLSPQRRADAALMVSELVTNALVHGTGTMTLRIDRKPDGVRVEVADEGLVSIDPSPTPGAHGGWGLRIVEELADDWGIAEGSTKVWFRLARRLGIVEFGAGPRVGDG